MFLADSKTFSLDMISGLEEYAIIKAHESNRDKVENSVKPKYEIDEYDQVATGTGASLHFKDVPIFGAPWFQFPVSGERRSGLLTPTSGAGSTRGVELYLPYYFNLAPNYDYTLTPRFMSKRGVMIGNEARLKLPHFEGEMTFDYLPNDIETGDSRYGMRVETQYRRDKLSFDIDYNRVSDDDYVSDFSGNIRESSQAVLPQEYTLNYQETYWSAGLKVTKHQMLDIDVDDDVHLVRPYERVPQVTLNGYNADFHGFELSTTLEATRFTHPKNRSDRLLSVAGSRLVLRPERPVDRRLVRSRQPFASELKPRRVHGKESEPSFAHLQP